MAGKFGSIDTCSESQYKAQRYYMGGSRTACPFSCYWAITKANAVIVPTWPSGRLACGGNTATH